MKQSFKAAFVTTLIAAPMASMAAGNITFTGKVIDQTCDVAVEGVANPQVVLPTVSAQQLNAHGTAGLTPFTIRISGCKTDHAGLAINTVFSGAAITADGNLQNTHATPAANVEVQLLKDASGSADSVIKLASVTPVSGLHVAAEGEQAQHEFAARYFTTGSAGAGEVRAVVNYDITYN